MPKADEADRLRPLKCRLGRHPMTSRRERVQDTTKHDRRSGRYTLRRGSAAKLEPVLVPLAARLTADSHPVSRNEPSLEFLQRRYGLRILAQRHRRLPRKTPRRERRRKKEHVAAAQVPGVELCGHVTAPESDRALRWRRSTQNPRRRGTQEPLPGRLSFSSSRPGHRSATVRSGSSRRRSLSMPWGASTWWAKVLRLRDRMSRLASGRKAVVSSYLPVVGLSFGPRSVGNGRASPRSTPLPALRLLRFDQFVDTHWRIEVEDLSFAQTPKHWRTAVTLE